MEQSVYFPLYSLLIPLLIMIMPKTTGRLSYIKVTKVEEVGKCQPFYKILNTKCKKPTD